MHSVHEFQYITNKRKLIPNFIEAWQQRLLLVSLIKRNLKLRYKQTMLGVLWVLIQPLAMSGVLVFVFNQFVPSTRGQTCYAGHVLIGVWIWQYFSRSVTDTSTCLVMFSGVLTKTYFPRILVPAASVLTGLFDFILLLPIIVGLVYYLYSPPFQALWLFLPICLLLVCFSIGIGLILSSVNVLYRDIQHAVPFIVQLGFYLTPVLYQVSALPERWKWWCQLNPLTGIIQSVQIIFLGGELPWTSLLCSTGIVMAMLFLGATVFASVEQTMVDKI